MPATWDTIDRYVVISTDTHAGADLHDYRQYLPKRLHDDFFLGADLRQPVRRSDRCDREAQLGPRTADVGDGCRRCHRRGAPTEYCAAVLPDHPEHHDQPAGHPSRIQPALGPVCPQAHNRWQVDFCWLAPTRRRGLIQIFPNDIRARPRRNPLGCRDRNASAACWYPPVSPGDPEHRPAVPHPLRTDLGALCRTRPDRRSGTPGQAVR